SSHRTTIFFLTLSLPTSSSSSYSLSLIYLPFLSLYFSSYHPLSTPISLNPHPVFLHSPIVLVERPPSLSCGGSVAAVVSLEPLFEHIQVGFPQVVLLNFFRSNRKRGSLFFFEENVGRRQW
ncbi:hypothetical protein F2P56_030648, partial [Juglans regia]